MSAEQPVKIAVVTVSDRASRGEYDDRGGPAIEEWFNKTLITAWEPIRRLIQDDQLLIEETLITLCDQEKVDLVVTTGGTGPAPRDVTPEATIAVSQKVMPGFGELMRAESLKVVPTAILSRQTAGIRGRTLIINLPGKPSAIDDCLNAVFPAVPYCIDLLEGPYIETHESEVKSFRPKHARLRREGKLE